MYFLVSILYKFFQIFFILLVSVIPIVRTSVVKKRMADFLLAAVLSALPGEFCMAGYGNNFHVVVIAEILEDVNLLQVLLVNLCMAQM